MSASDNYMLFGSICTLAFISFMACVEAYRATVQANAARLQAQDALLSSRTMRSTVDNLKKSVSPGCKDTMAVSDTEGFSPRDSWTDDFHKTQFLERLGKKQLRRQMSWWQRWLKSFG